MSRTSNRLDLVRFALNGLKLIEASAGTGKTYSIAALYVRLVLGHGRDGQAPLTPPEILVLTYTRSATQELRDRVRARLTEVAAAFRSATAGSDQFIAALLAEYPSEAHRTCARRLQLAAEWMDEAAIHTIHAWCQTMLRQHAFDSGSLFEQEVGSEDRELFDQVVKDYWRRHFYPRRTPSDVWEQPADGPAKLAKTVRDLLKPGLAIELEGEEIAGLAPDKALDQLLVWRQDREIRLQVLAESWLRDRSEIVDALNGAVGKKFLNRPYSKKGQLQAWFEQLDRWAHGEIPAPDLDPFRPDCIGNSVSKRAGASAPEHDWFEHVAATLDAVPPCPPVSQAIWPHAVRWIQARYQEEKARRHRLDFDDLLTELDQALSGERGGPLRQRILQKFPVALIDEFQDTDPVQYRIFERVYLPERDHPQHALIMIGDPKQSIYSFRGADIHTYLAARARTSGDDRFTLPVNYRSTKPMVEAVNRLFGAGHLNRRGAFGFCTDEDDPVPFEPVSARGRPDRLVIEGRDAASLTFWYQPPPDKGPLAKNAHQPLMAERTARQIVKLLNGSRRERPQNGFIDEDGRLRPILPSDIAVLVNHRHDAALIQKALRARGVGSAYLSDRDSVFDQPEAVDVLTILEAAAHPLDGHRVRKALATASVSLSLHELDAVRRQENCLEQEIVRFQRCAMIWQQQGVLAMLRHLMAEKSVPARLMARGAGWERQLTNLLHLAELLQTHSDRQDGAQGLINWLQAEIARDNRSENESEIIRLESDADLIRIVTVHKSKGLQYPLVFVPFASCYISPKSPPFLSYHADDGRRVAELDTTNPTAIERSRQAAVQERIRLLYVALTRARHACWVGVASVNGCPEAGLNQLLSGLADSVDPDGRTGLHAALDTLASNSPQIALIDASAEYEKVTEVERLLPGGADFVCEAAPEYPVKARKRWWIASYSALRYGDALQAREAEQNPDAARIAEMLAEDHEEGQEAADEAPMAAHRPASGSVHAFPRGAAAGTLLHDLLEWAGNCGFAAALENEERLHEQIRSRLTRRQWQNQIPVVRRWLARQLRVSIRLADHSVRLVDLQPDRHQYRPELGFLLAAGDVDVGQLDELVRAHTLNGHPRPAFRPESIRGMLTGFIDLVFEHEGRWYVADYKSNYLGPDAGNYSHAGMAGAMLEKRYDLQFVFYTLALHRLLRQRLGNAYRPAEHLGGAAYLFLRGCDNEQTGGVFYEPASIELIEALDRLFAGTEVSDVE